MSSSKATEVKDLITSDNVVIFSKTYCPYCRLAKEVSVFLLQCWFVNLTLCDIFHQFQVFDKIQQKYTTIELDMRNDGEEIQGILAQITGARTVNIFVVIYKL